MMSKCPICGDNTDNPLIATFMHFRLIDFAQFSFVRGTFRTFGLREALTLICPLANTLIHWKYRKARLVIPK